MKQSHIKRQAGNLTMKKLAFFEAETQSTIWVQIQLFPTNLCKNVLHECFSTMSYK